METEDYWERYRTPAEIRAKGALTNLGDGVPIRAHGIDARVIAWPGNGFRTESVHVLTLKPGEESERYAYDMAEEALVCFKGKGQIFLRGRWVDVEPGDIAYHPFTAERALRNPAGTATISSWSRRSRRRNSTSTLQPAFTIPRTRF